MAQLVRFTEDLLRVVFLLLASPADLVRASAACTSFRRIITKPEFLRRYRSIHPPLFLGFLGQHRFHPTVAPDYNAPAGRDLARAAAGFSFHHIPLTGRRPWQICDVRDGRVLLKSVNHYTLFPGLAVCDPLSRQYVRLPAIPNDLVASVQVQGHNLESFDVVLVPCGDQEDTAFEVVAIPYYREQTFVAFIFCSGSGVWRASAPANRDALSLDLFPAGDTMLGPHHYAYGCFYWQLSRNNKLIKLDVNSMKFSSIHLPPDHDTRRAVIVEAGEGLLGMISRTYQNSGPFLYYTISQNGGERLNEWKMEKTIPMPTGFNYYSVCASEGHIFLFGCPEATMGNMTSDVCFSLDLNTFKIEMVGRMTVRVDTQYIFPYFGFLPSISPKRL
ncbi:hypothetical protein EJB05_50722, partial [Eragrostis curvula]